jgi:hypothetical protein
MYGTTRKKNDKKSSNIRKIVLSSFFYFIGVSNQSEAAKKGATKLYFLIGRRDPLSIYATPCRLCLYFIASFQHDITFS